jgi:hypothetical protein
LLSSGRKVGSIDVEEGMSERRYFATVVARDRPLLRDLAGEDLDLFQATAKEAEVGRYTIEGLLTIEEVQRLVDSGYEVVVHEDASKRARAQAETTEFGQWLRDMGV